MKLTSKASARLSLVLSLGLIGVTPWLATPALDAQQSGVRTDLAIQSDVLKALSNYPDISSEHITANTADGVVTLAGTASSDTAKNQAQVVAATVDGVRSVVNNVSVDASATPSPQQDAQSQPQQEPVQQAQSNNPDQQTPAYSEGSQPKPGTSGNWGKAGPPPDVQNGQIPQPPQQSAQPQNAQGGDEYPMQDPGQEPSQTQQPQQPQQQQGPYQRLPYPGNGNSSYGNQGYGAPNNGNPYPQQARAYPPRKLATSPVTIPAGALFSVRTSEPLDSRRLLGGEPFQAVAAQDVYEGEYLAIPRGAVLQGRVIGVKKPGAFRGGAGFALQLTSLSMGGQNYPVTTDTFATDTRGKGGYTTANTIGGAAIGALIGAVAGGGPGAAIGAAAGGAGGLGVSAATPGPREIMPPETLLTFHLRTPLTVNPISYAEAQRLTASVTPRRPAMRPPPPPYAYGYPPPPPPPYYYPYYPYRYYSYWR